jgi:hypothetical protein
MFLLRVQKEDTYPDEFQPGTIFDLTLPIWRFGEGLLRAQRPATALACPSSSVFFRVTWEGLSGRILRSRTNSRRILFEDRGARQGSVTSEAVVPTDRIATSLPEIVGNLTKPLYETFDFFEAPLEMIRQELSAMRG